MSPAFNQGAISKTLEFFFKIGLVYISYFLFAKIATLLVMPPGQASVIWPAAGIALALIYVFGNKVAIGIFLAALTNSLGYYDDIGISQILVASTIAFGASLQAVLGAILTKKIYRNNSLLGNLRDTITFMFLGGPVACLVSASIASTALISAEAISITDFWTHSFSWWIGDVFGVVVFAPIGVIILTKTEKLKLTFKRKLIVAVPMLISLAAFATLFNIAKNELVNRSYQEYQSETAKITHDFTQDVAVNIANIEAIAAFFNASTYVSADEFKTFTASLLKHSEGLYGVSWLPKVINKNRQNFVESIQKQGFTDYRIQSRLNDGSLIQAKEREVYFPLAYTEPYQRNKLAHGFDVYGQDGVSGNIRRDILDSARDENQAKATSRFSIVQKQDEYGFIVYYPVYSVGKHSSLEELRDNHIGYINGIYVFPNLVKTLLKDAKNINSDFVLVEITGAEPTLLFDSRTSDFKEGDVESYNFDSITHTTEVLDIAGKNWEIIFLRKTSLLSEHYINALWGYIVGGIIFHFLLLIILTTITARNDYIENLVEEKTNELKQANAELEEFAYRTSHDLRSPLVSSIKLLELSERYIEEGDKKQANEVITMSIRSLNKLEVLIMDILNLTKTKNMEEEKKDINISVMIQESLEKIHNHGGFKDIEISQNLKFSEKIYTKQNRIQLIVENLISNAVKYYDPKKEKSFIRIETRKQNNCFIFCVEDNGLGIPKESQKKLFTMFKRFHTNVSFGSGLGLYMIKKSAAIIGGDVVYEDMGGGSRFTLKIPMQNISR